MVRSLAPLTLPTVFAACALTSCALDYSQFSVAPDASTGGGASGGGGNGAQGGSGAQGGGTAGAGATGASSSGGGGQGAGGGGGCQNYALSFDGSNDYVEVADDPELDSFGPITIEAWIYPSAASFAKESQILSHHYHDTKQGYVLMMISNGGIQLRYQGSGTQFQVGGGLGSEPMPDKWTHVAGSYDGDKLRVFVDGVKKQETDIGSQNAADYPGPLHIGGASYTQMFPFAGLIDEVRISDTARYTDDYTPPTAPFAVDGDTIALWHFDEGSGEGTADVTGNHDGQLGMVLGPDDRDPAWVCAGSGWAAP